MLHKLLLKSAHQAFNVSRFVQANIGKGSPYSITERRVADPGSWQVLPNTVAL